LSDLLDAVRRRPRLIERNTAVFYVGGRAFLHFHLEPPGMIAHLRMIGGWQRLPVNTTVERRRFLAALDRTIRAPVD
jgi:hypothetical protein